MIVYVCDCCKESFKADEVKELIEPRSIISHVCKSCFGIREGVLKELTREYEKRLTDLREWYNLELKARFQRYAKESK